MVLPQTVLMHCGAPPENTRSSRIIETPPDHLLAGKSTDAPTTSTEPSSNPTDFDAPPAHAERARDHLKASMPRVLVLSILSTMLSLLCLFGLTSYLYFNRKPELNTYSTCFRAPMPFLLPVTTHRSGRLAPHARIGLLSINCGTLVSDVMCGLPASLRTASSPPPSSSEEDSTKQSKLDATWERSSRSGGRQDEGALSMDADEDSMLPPVPLISPFVPIWGLQDIPLLGVQNMGTLTLKWNDPHNGGTTEMVFQVDSITRSFSDIRAGTAPVDPEKTTTLLLSSGHTFVVKNERAHLFDPAGRLIHSMFRSRQSSDTVPASSPDGFSTSNNTDAVNSESIRSGHTSSQLLLRRRRLQHLGDGLHGGIKRPKKPKGFAPAFLPNGPPAKGGGPPTSFMDAYCRYGCGGMSVTFPYYYRPFFGYGFPLVGTEAMFPQGYGGYAAAPLLASQGGVPAMTGAGGPVIAGGLPAGSLTPGVGAANVVGGVQPVAVALPGI